MTLGGPYQQQIPAVPGVLARPGSSSCESIHRLRNFYQQSLGSGMTIAVWLGRTLITL